MTAPLQIMNSPVTKVGLFLKGGLSPKSAEIKNLIRQIRKSKMSFAWSQLRRGQKTSPVGSIPLRQLISQSQCLVSLGGDGTMLQLARATAQFGAKPIIGLNLGRMGFLTQIKKDEMNRALKSLREGRYRVKDRMILQVRVMRAQRKIFDGFCLNEIVIHRKLIARIIDLKIDVQGMPLSRVRGDGLIISTPMGSTAYSLSAGGPILHPAVQDIVLTFLAPHSLSNRPVVLPSQYKITVTTEETDPTITLNLTTDGQEEVLVRPGDVIEIERSNRAVTLIDLNQPGKFFEILQEKLHWRI